MSLTVKVNLLTAGKGSETINMSTVGKCDQVVKELLASDMTILRYLGNSRGTISCVECDSKGVQRLSRGFLSVLGNDSFEIILCANRYQSKIFVEYNPLLLLISLRNKIEIRETLLHG